MKNKIGVVCLCLAVSAPAIFAQVTGTLSGSVVDPSGAGIGNADIKILLPGGSAPVISGKTTSEGLYSLIGVRPGTFDVRIEAGGFVPAELHGIKVNPISETSLPPVRLQLAAVSQSVEVTAETQSVETANAQVASTVSSSQIERLPLLN